MPRDPLAVYRQQVEAIILSRQDAHTGLLPASTAITVHGDYTHAWVRDNVYSILAVWALAVAYRRKRQVAVAADLEERVNRLMRGLLAAMMRQAPKVERFKVTQDPLDALHAKYATRSGEPVVGDADWGHLQIDATAIYLLMLAHMTKAGLSIVQQPDEAAFVQNLVHYLARAWRTPDFGIWERGHKRNEGVAEINASSVGMAKAALEAIDGLQLLPARRAPAVHVQADDVAYARKVLKALLPRESDSKETDAALLAVIGFPAFAVEAELAQRTRTEIVEKLQGRYGCKRFLRDGHQTVLEDHARLHYEPGELRQFEHIESEWPLFFTYLMIDAVWRGDAAQAADYRSRLDDLMQERDGQRLLPELYIVPAEAVDAERARPHSQTRVPNENVPLVWAQSLYLVGALLQEGHVRPLDLDPRAVPSAAVPDSEVEVQLALLAEDDVVAARLRAAGITAETLPRGPSLVVCEARQLQAALAELGHCEALGLSGRPPFGVGGLASAQVYPCGHQTVIVLPAFLDRGDTYLSLDNPLLIEEIEAEISYLQGHWRGPGQPLLALRITGAMLDAPGAAALTAYLAELSTRVAAGPLAKLVSRARKRRVDWLDRWPAGDAEAPRAAPAALPWDEASTRTLTAERAVALERESDDAALDRRLGASRNPYEQLEILALLTRRLGPQTPSGAGATLQELCLALYRRAGAARRWGLVRHAAAVLGLHDPSLEDAVAQFAMRGKRIALGRGAEDDDDAVIAKPLAQAELVERLRRHGGDELRSRVLTQEIVLLLGLLMKADRGLFEGTLTTRPWTLMTVLTTSLAREHGITLAEAFDHLLELSPGAILARLREAIAHEREMAAGLAGGHTLRYFGPADALVLVRLDEDAETPVPEGHAGWHAWREAAGAITRVPANFHARVWEVLRHVTGVVIGDAFDIRNFLESALLRADMTAAERGFALLVDNRLNKIQAPEYRQLTIEALLAAADLCDANPDLRIEDALVVDELLARAVRLGWSGPERDVASAWQAFYASPPNRVANLLMTALAGMIVPPKA